MPKSLSADITSRWVSSIIFQDCGCKCSMVSNGWDVTSPFAWNGRKRKKFSPGCLAECAAIENELIRLPGAANSIPPYWLRIQLGKKRIAEIGEINDGLAEQHHLPKSYIDTLRHDLNLVAFAVCICCFPEKRIAIYSVKTAHSRLSLERQLMKKYNVADFSFVHSIWCILLCTKSLKCAILSSKVAKVFPNIVPNRCKRKEANICQQMKPRKNMTYNMPKTS